MKVTVIARARPTVMKIALTIHSIKLANESGKDINSRLIHNWQYNDKKMSGIPPLWKGYTTKRFIEVLVNQLKC